MKKRFFKNKIYAGGSDRPGIPLCHSLGKAVFTYASSEIKSPFIMVSRGDSCTEEVLQIAVGDAICASGGEVLLVDSLTVPAAALLTRKYRADFTVAIDGDYAFVLDGTGANITRENEQKIEKIIEEGTYLVPPKGAKDGEFYCRRDAYLDYTSALTELSGRRKIRSKIALGGKGAAVQKAARQIFSMLSKNVFVFEGGPAKEIMTASGADIGFYFDRAGRDMTVINTEGDAVSPEDAFCLIAAKIAEKDALGNSLKGGTGKGVRLAMTESGAVHFGDLLPGPDALFTAVMLSVYLSDKDEPLQKLIEELKS